MNHLQVRSTEAVISVRDPTIVGTHGTVKVAVCFIEQQRHPNRDEAAGQPGVVVIAVGNLDIDKAEGVQLS